MKEMIAVVMASTGLDAKSAKERLEKALAEMETVAEYAAVIAPTPKPPEVTP